MKRFPLLVSALALAGCALQPPYERPSAKVPQAWRGATTLPDAQPTFPDKEWWRAFDDPALDALQRQVLEGNHDLMAASQRIMEARALARIAASAGLPVLDLNVGAKRASKLSGREGASTFSTNVSASFEPDLWEKFQNVRRAADAGVLAATEAQRAVAITLVSDAANAYFLAATLTQRIDLTRKSIAAAERIDAVVDSRYRAGAVSGLDRAQSKTNLASIRATLPPLEQARVETENALAVLTAQNPGEVSLASAALPKAEMTRKLAVGAPPEMLQRRPDIRLAEANLMGAYASIGSAKANLYPTLKLTADAGYESGQLRNLLRGASGLLNLAAGLVAPIFDRDRLEAATDQAKARYEELLQQYHQSVLGALRDVENALVAFDKSSALEIEQTEAATQAQRAFELAETRYRAGLTDVINLLTAQNVHLTAQNGLLQARLARVSAVINLYKALGGGW